MKMCQVHIKHFKSLEDVHLNCGNLISLIGENNSGKSNIIEALDLFFNPSIRKVTEEIFYEKKTSKPIEIIVTFKDLNEWEVDYFSAWLCDHRLKVKRTIQWDDPPKIHNVAIVRVPEPEWLREDIVNKAKIEEWWDNKEELIVAGIRFDEYLGIKKPTINGWREAISHFLEEHREDIPWVDKEIENPRGYAGVLKGGLPKFILVPAVRDVSEEIKVGKTNPFGLLINTLLSGISCEHRSEIRNAVEQVRRLINRTEGRERIPEIREIEKRLKGILRPLIECDIEIEFPISDLNSIFSSVRMYVDDGLKTSVETKGHGLQRSIIFAILRAYAELIRGGETGEEGEDKSVIFAIEEPELYLHPQAQRSMMQVMRTISEGKDQVIYSTHSSLFVDIEYFDEICLMRREQIEGHWKSTATQLSMDAMISDLITRFPNTSPTPQSMRDRYSHVYSASRSEGFFARKVVLVEGLTEEYAIPIYSHALRYDMDSEGVSVISSGGKGQIDRLFRIFNEFKIPCYVVFDGDKSSEDSQAKRLTRELLELMGKDIDGFPPTIVERRFAVFEEKFEKTMKEEVPEYSSIVEEARRELGLKSDSGAPLIARYMARKLVEKGNREGDPSKYVPPTIKQIIEKVKELKWEGSILRCE